MRSDQVDEEKEPWLYRKAAELGDWWRCRHPAPKPSIDRKYVRDRYQEAIWPILKEHGFNDFADCGAWRHATKHIDVVYLRFFPKPKTLQWGLTPFSFTVEAGVFLPFIPLTNPLKLKLPDGHLLPQEVDCHMRHSPIERRLKQRKNRIPNIWYVEPDGGNLGEVLQDVKHVLVEDVLPWFEMVGDLKYIMGPLIKTQQDEERGDLKLNAWGISSFTPGFIALELGEWQLAAESLQKALDSGAYSATKFADFSPSGGDPRYRTEEERYKAKRIKHVETLEEQIRTALGRAQSELTKQAR